MTETLEKISGSWMPIESAPKDGTAVLAYLDWAGTDFVCVAWFRSEQDWQDSGQYCASEGETMADWIGWWTYISTVSQERLEGWRTPTHWMPMPEDPSALPGEGE